MATKKVKTEQAYLVEFQGQGDYGYVIFGYCEPSELKTVRPTLKRARMLCYCSEATKGTLGAASHGPKQGCNVSPAVPEFTICAPIFGYSACTPIAVNGFEEARWDN